MRCHHPRIDGGHDGAWSTDVAAGVGVAGRILHLIVVVRSAMDSLWDRVVYGAPLFAPLLFADLAAIIGFGTLYARAPHGQFVCRPWLGWADRTPK